MFCLVEFPEYAVLLKKVGLCGVNCVKWSWRASRGGKLGGCKSCFVVHNGRVGGEAAALPCSHCSWVCSQGVESRPVCCQCLQPQPFSLPELCSALRSRGNSACGKHKVCRLWIESSCKAACRCWQALEIGSQHADVGCLKLGWNCYFLSFFSVKKYLSDKSYFLLDGILHAFVFWVFFTF